MTFRIFSRKESRSVNYGKTFTWSVSTLIFSLVFERLRSKDWSFRKTLTHELTHYYNWMMTQPSATKSESKHRDIPWYSQVFESEISNGTGTSVPKTDWWINVTLTSIQLLMLDDCQFLTRLPSGHRKINLKAHGGGRSPLFVMMGTTTMLMML